MKVLILVTFIGFAASFTISAFAFKAYAISHSYVRPKPVNRISRKQRLSMSNGEQERVAAENSFNITSAVDILTNLQAEIDSLTSSISTEDLTLTELEVQKKALDDEFGGAIERMQKELARLKKREKDNAFQMESKALVEAAAEYFPVIDDYYRAKEAFESMNLTESAQTLVRECSVIFKQLEEALADLGIKRMTTVGLEFDPQNMEALATMASTEVDAGYVMKEFQIGYKMGYVTARPAVVIVSSGPA